MLQLTATAQCITEGVRAGIQAGTEAEAVEECCSLACSQANLWRCFSHSGSLLSNGSSLCQVDRKKNNLTRTVAMVLGVQCAERERTEGEEMVRVNG